MDTGWISLLVKTTFVSFFVLKNKKSIMYKRSKSRKIKFVSGKSHTGGRISFHWKNCKKSLEKQRQLHKIRSMQFIVSKKCLNFANLESISCTVLRPTPNFCALRQTFAPVKSFSKVGRRAQNLGVRVQNRLWNRTLVYKVVLKLSDPSPCLTQK